MPEPSGKFATTQWSLIAAAAEAGAPEGRAALAEFCTRYWYPVYAFIRRKGHDIDQAQDLTQEFFAQLLERETLGAADRRRGRFRTFLLTACQNFLVNERQRASAQKRGGGRRLLSIDVDGAECRYAHEPAHTMTPERLFERRWALTLLDHVLERLRDEMAGAGKAALFEALKPVLTDGEATAYSRIAETLGMTEGAIKVASHRLRQRYRALLREEIGRTLDDPHEVDEELRDLRDALSC